MAKSVTPTSSPTFASLRQELRKGITAPVYLLHGEEGYYIDRLVEDFETLVPPEERDFNLYILYGPEVTPEAVMDTCRRYPMMAEKVVVILKEAQSMRTDAINRLHQYVAHPSPSTILAVCCRGEKAKGKDFLAAMKKGGNVIFESKKLTDRTIGPEITNLIKDKGLNIEPKGLTMLRDYIGADLAKLYNEIDKLALVLGKGAMVTPEAIERNIGISKDFNNYELVDALAARDSKKAYRIIEYFKSNPKNNPLPVTTAAIFNYFSSLIILQFCRQKTPQAYMEALGLRNQWQLKNFETGLRNYNAFQTMEIISAIRTFDTRSKGIGSRQNEHALMRDLVFHILTAPGQIKI